MVEINYANTPDKLQSGLKQSNKIQVVDKNLNEIRNERLVDYSGECEMVCSSKVGDQNRQTHIRFRNLTDYEAYINSFDEVYDAEDAIFKCFLYKIITSEFNLVDRSQYGNACDFKHETIEYRGKNCFIPTNGYCFVNCIKYSTGEES